jgi:hypothetical protein
MTNTSTAIGATDDSLLLCASDLQHSAIYDNHAEMQACIRAVANRIAALASAAAPAEQPNTAYAELPEPDSYLFQHDETGLTQHVDAQQVEWGFERNNPRLRRVSGTFTEPQMRAFADATHALRASRGQAPAGAAPDEQMPILRWIMKTADAAKEPCGDDPESPSAVRNATLAAIAGAAAQALGLVRGGPSYEDTAPHMLEDAEMLDWLEARGTVAIERCKYLGSDDTVIEVTPYNDDSYEGDTLRDAIRAAMAAKKGGE